MMKKLLIIITVFVLILLTLTVSVTAMSVSRQDTLLLKAAEEYYSTKSDRFMWPVPGSGLWEITDYYGYRVHPLTGLVAFHSGLDIGAYMGEPVRSVANGTVIRAGWYGGYGNCVMVDSGYLYPGQYFVTLYAHLSEFDCRKGDAVKAGDVIGYVGSTGDSTGPHLHFEIIINGYTTDPLPYLETYSTEEKAYE